MKRRADLTFRAETPEAAFQLDNLKLTNPDEAIVAGNDGQSDLFIAGTIVQMGKPIIAESDGWDWKNCPSSFRQVLVLKQSQKRAFRVYLFGSYATDFMLLNPQIGEEVAIIGRPMLKKSRFPQTDIQLNEVRVGLKDLDSCKICLSPAKKNSKNSPAKNPRQNLKFVQDFKMAAKKLNSNQNQICYTLLKDCNEVSKTYNTWAIVTKIQRFPKPTKSGNKIMAMVYIEDQHSRGTFGFSNYQFSILGPLDVAFPPIVLHSIMRIHHMKVEQYQGDMTFRVLDPRAVTVIQGKLGDPVVPECTKSAENLTFSQADMDKVEELRAWWAQEAKNKNVPDTNGLSQVSLSNQDNAGNQVSDDTLNALLAPLESQSQVDSAPPLTTIYPSNIDGFAIVDSQPDPGDPGSQAASSVDELSQPFYTCPDENSQDSGRLSPSPERQFKYVITTNTNFMWMNIEELQTDEVEDAANNFRINGHICNVDVTKKQWKNCLCRVCLDCCLVANYDATSCAKCKKEGKLSFHIGLTFQEPRPEALPKSVPQLKLYLAGHHAQSLLQVSAEEFAKNTSKREAVMKKLQDLNGQPVILSVCRMFENGKNVSYQIVHSVFS